jgi:hypothetical protein
MCQKKSKVTLLMVLVESVIRRLPNSFSPVTIHGRTHEYKWSLLKVREGNYKAEQGGDLEAENTCLSFSGAFKIYPNL